MADKRVVGSYVATAACSGLAVIAAVALPWATYEDLATGSVTGFSGGAWCGGLVVLAVSTFALATVRLCWPSSLLATAQVATAAGSLAAAIGLALTQIASANERLAAVNSSTSYAIGSAVGVVAALALVVTSAVSRGLPRSTSVASRSTTSGMV